jgi:SAM-dependent methyltransferase
VVPYVPAGARRVLEIGCGRGATGALLQRELGCRVTGVDLNPVVAAAAAGVLDRAVAGDVEDPAVVARLGDGWDALVALELFEHLTDQEAFLATALRLVRPGGRIVLSVPNVGHWSVVEDLLAGRWDYLPIGLLCYTHFRFFTRRTLEDWLARAGCRRFRLVPQHTEPPAWLAGLDGPAGLGGGLEADPESLRTKGFWVLIDVE